MGTRGRTSAQCGHAGTSIRGRDVSGQRRRNYEGVVFEQGGRDKSTDVSGVSYRTECAWGRLSLAAPCHSNQQDKSGVFKKKLRHAIETPSRFLPLLARHAPVKKHSASSDCCKTAPAPLPDIANRTFSVTAPPDATGVPFPEGTGRGAARKLRYRVGPPKASQM